MDKIIKILFILLLIALTSHVKAQNNSSSATDLILRSYSARVFTTGPVKESDLDLILKCGIKAPSARNSQGWKFIVLRNTEIAGTIITNLTPGNVIIIIAGPEAGPTGINPDFDCALATENMYIAAQSLGYGAHMYTGPVSGVNQKKDIYGIPEGFRAVSILRIGTIDSNIDATSSASTRKTAEEIVIYK